MGPTVYRPNPTRLESLTICRYQSFQLYVFSLKFHAACYEHRPSMEKKTESPTGAEVMTLFRDNLQRCVGDFA